MLHIQRPPAYRPELASLDIRTRPPDTRQNDAARRCTNHSQSPKTAVQTTPLRVLRGQKGVEVLRAPLRSPRRIKAVAVLRVPPWPSVDKMVLKFSAPLRVLRGSKSSCRSPPPSADKPPFTIHYPLPFPPLPSPRSFLSCHPPQFDPFHILCARCLLNADICSHIVSFPTGRIRDGCNVRTWRPKK